MNRQLFFQKILGKRWFKLSFFGLLLLFIFLIGLIVFIFLKPASPPGRVRVSNVTENSLTISWVTEKPVRGQIFFTDQDNKFLRTLKFGLGMIIPQILKPESDDFNSPATVHYVTLSGLRPKTEYYYRINYNSRSYKLDQNGEILPSIKTTETLAELPSNYPAYGSLLDWNEETPQTPVLVYLSHQDSSLISGYTNSEGNWCLNLGNLRTKDLGQAFNFSQEKMLTFEAEGGALGSIQQALFIDYCQPMANIILEIND